MLKRFLAAVITIAMLLSSIPQAYAESPVKSGAQEETQGNLHNDGLVAVSGDWIYFINPDQNDAIYKRHKDQTTITRVNQDRSKQLNIVGDWIYYFKSVGYHSASESYELYKIRTDGTGRKKIPTKESLDDRAYMYVVGGWIYIKDFKFFKIKTDGTGYKDFGLSSLYDVVVAGNRIYYTADKTVMSFDLEGKNKKKLYESKLGYIPDLAVYKDWIYFTTLDNSIRRMKTDGTDEAPILKLSTKAIQYSMLMNVGADAIYYSDEEHVFKMNLDGSANEEIPLLSERRAYDMNLAFNQLFYRSGISDLVRIGEDGAKRKVLLKNIGAYVDISVQKDSVYYILSSFNGKDQLRSVGLDGSNDKHVLDLKELYIDDWIIANGYLYYSTEHGTDNTEIYKVSLNTFKSTRVAEITESNIRLEHIENNWIYYSTNNSWNSKSEEPALMRVNDKGTKSAVIKTNRIMRSIDSFNFTNGWVYYTQINKKSGKEEFYRASYDGTKAQKLSDRYPVGPSIIHGDRVFFHYGRQYYVTSIQSPTTKLFMSEYVSETKYNKGFIYYNEGRLNGLFKLNLDTKQKKTLSFENVMSVHTFQDGWVYYESRDNLFLMNLTGTAELNVTTGKENVGVSAIKPDEGESKSLEKSDAETPVMDSQYVTVKDGSGDVEVEFELKDRSAESMKDLRRISSKYLSSDEVTELLYFVENVRQLPLTEPPSFATWFINRTENKAIQIFFGTIMTLKIYKAGATPT
ncbi:DUF5050 domain-containing protein [Cohnella sp. WQ 127256]|uniref:DUF5050 domain-containing protein n=1 Tax=Cohnella sp. WQ 127256 TaxID=2938790 RepID=UPI002118A1B6|nr:DUF5050 domain-containing protein [Cohnella sp. WQ 127256]